MKKVVCLIIALLMLSTTTILPISSLNTQNEFLLLSTSYNDDGSYFVTTLENITTSRSTTQTITGRKNIHLYNSSDELVWTYTIIGTFSLVKGVSVQCTNSTYSSVIYDDAWSLTSHNNYCSGNIAYGTATYKKKVLFITTNTYDINAELGCDINGNLS